MRSILFVASLLLAVAACGTSGGHDAASPADADTPPQSIAPQQSRRCENLSDQIRDIDLVASGIAVATVRADQWTKDVSLLRGNGCALQAEPGIAVTSVTQLSGVDRFGGLFTIDLDGRLWRTDSQSTEQLSSEVIARASVGENMVLTNGADGLGVWQGEPRNLSSYGSVSASSELTAFATDDAYAVVMNDGFMTVGAAGVRLLNADGVRTWKNVSMDFGLGAEPAASVRRCGDNACTVHDNGFAVWTLQGELVREYPLTLVENLRGEGDILRTAVGDEVRGYYALIYRLGATRVLYFAPPSE